MLTAAEAQQLDRLAFGPFTPAPAEHGGRVSRARGAGLEFHDFRRYQPGDDVRSIDWTVLARLGQLVVREFRADARLRLHVLLDTSRSMALGAPSKISCAKKLVSMLCYVAARGHDALALACFDETVRERIALGSGTAQAGKIIATVAGATAAGRSDVNSALTSYGALVHGPGAAIVVSDFFDPREPIDGLRFLLHRGLTPCVVQVVAPEELNPPAVDAIELVDAETPAASLAVGRDAAAAYRRVVAGEVSALSSLCAELGIPRLLVTTSMSFADLLAAASAGGLLTGRG